MNSSPNSERSRLARELHDGLAQELAAVGYQLDQVVGDPSLDNNNRRVIREIRSTLSGVIKQVRDEIFELRNNSNTSSTLQISDQVGSILENCGIEFFINGEIQFNSTAKFDVLRAIRELVINAKRHSGCSQITINLEPSKITIIDNGSGGATGRNGSYGLTGVIERMHLIGAKVNIDSNTAGTKVEIILN
jgi:NarL family two-component system sensor histidine kinase LiaS